MISPALKCHAPGYKEWGREPGSSNQLGKKKRWPKPCIRHTKQEHKPCQTLHTYNFYEVTWSHNQQLSWCSSKTYSDGPMYSSEIYTLTSGVQDDKTLPQHLALLITQYHAISNNRSHCMLPSNRENSWRPNNNILYHPHPRWGSAGLGEKAPCFTRSATRPLQDNSYLTFRSAIISWAHTDYSARFPEVRNRSLKSTTSKNTNTWSCTLPSWESVHNTYLTLVSRTWT